MQAKLALCTGSYTSSPFAVYSSCAGDKGHKARVWKFAAVIPCLHSDWRGLY